ncbi:MAG: Trk system potassium transporter TrkA, partial [Chloroflexota bacterium]|nr:Trk system potassium transporter TrkA [Chloroflexota bacterium]
AGDIGRAVVDALQDEHEITVIDLDPVWLDALSDRYDVRTIEGNGTTRDVLGKARVADSDLLIACTSREESNLVCAMLVKRLSHAKTIVRTTSMEYLEAWREREIDVDFMVSSELETANAISTTIGMPAARQTDVFAEGQVQIVEFDVPADVSNDALIGRRLRDADIPADSKVVGLIRGDRMVLPRGDEQVLPRDRIVVIASPESARRWSLMIAPSEQVVDDVVVFGAGRMGTMITRVLLERGIRVRLVDAQRDRAREVAEALPDARVFHAAASDPEFLERERIGQTGAAIFCMNDDAKNLYAAVLAKVRGVRLTIALVRDAVSADVYERGGVDVAINPRQVITEEMVRFAHDPRIRQISMIEGDRFECLDITVRPDSDLANKPFRDLPTTDSLIGAVIRDGTAMFPRSSDVLRAGDRVIIFTESRYASLVERAL